MYQAPEERGRTILSVFKPEKEIYFGMHFFTTWTSSLCLWKFKLKILAIFVIIHLKKAKILSIPLCVFLANALSFIFILSWNFNLLYDFQSMHASLFVAKKTLLQF